MLQIHTRIWSLVAMVNGFPQQQELRLADEPPSMYKQSQTFLAYQQLVAILPILLVK